MTFCDFLTFIWRLGNGGYRESAVGGISIQLLLRAHKSQIGVQGAYFAAFGAYFNGKKPIFWPTGSVVLTFERTL